MNGPYIIRVFTSEGVGWEMTTSLFSLVCTGGSVAMGWEVDISVSLNMTFLNMVLRKSNSAGIVD